MENFRNERIIKTFTTFFYLNVKFLINRFELISTSFTYLLPNSISFWFISLKLCHRYLSPSFEILVFVELNFRLLVKRLKVG